MVSREEGRGRRKATRPDTRHKMRLVCVLFTIENNAGPTDGPTDRRTDGRTDGPTDQRTDGRTDGGTKPIIELRVRN